MSASVKGIVKSYMTFSLSFIPHIATLLQREDVQEVQKRKALV